MNGQQKRAGHEKFKNSKLKKIFQKRFRVIFFCKKVKKIAFMVEFFMKTSITRVYIIIKIIFEIKLNLEHERKSCEIGIIDLI